MSEFPCCQSLTACTGALVTAIMALAWCLKIEVQRKLKKQTLHILIMDEKGNTKKTTAEEFKI